MNKPKIITVVGTTASSKSSLGIELAKIFDGEVVSADSRQVYKGMDLGTGKVTEEEIQGVPHHMLDIISPNEPFSVADFQRMAYPIIDDIIARGKLPIIVGGTGLYTRAIVEGFSLSECKPDEKLRAELDKKTCEELVKILHEHGIEDIKDPQNKRRLVRQIEKIEGGTKEQAESNPRYDVLQLGMTFDRDVLYQRIGERLDIRINDGMVEEIKGLMDAGATPEFLESLGLEYRYTYRYLTGKYKDFQEYHDDLFKHIRHFAKRQVTWFKKEKNIVWLDTKKDYLSEATKLVEDFLKEDDKENQ